MSHGGRWPACLMLAAALAGMAPMAGACELQVLASTDQALLSSVPMGASRDVALSYLHSVTRTPVRETLSLDAQGFVQRRIEFTEHGPGMPTEPLAGERFVREKGRFVVEGMARRIGVLRMRVDPAQFQTLDAAGRTLALTQWGARGLMLRALDCD